MTRFVIPDGGTRFVSPDGGTRFVSPGEGTRFVSLGEGTPIVIGRARSLTAMLGGQHIPVRVVDLARLRRRFAGPLLVSCALIMQGCAKRPTHEECEALLDHYVELLVNSDRPGTNAAEKHKLQLQAREKAKEDPEFAACSERVSRREFDCAMSASNADLLEQCLL
ncbi:MAG TPA: hypothetical protein VHM25_19870 [Polyangiaceae bacterium]|nr:hypothetical protein [Polyangiaceae bacterium]